MTVLRGCAHRINADVGPSRGEQTPIFSCLKNSLSPTRDCPHQPREGERIRWGLEKGKEHSSRDQISWSIQTMNEVKKCSTGEKKNVAWGVSSYANVLSLNLELSLYTPPQKGPLRKITLRSILTAQIQLNSSLQLHIPFHYIFLWSITTK